jgi:hypothetical protein
MLPRESLKNSSRGEFSCFALSDKENEFVLTYADYVLNPFKSMSLKKRGGGGHLSYTD